MYQTDGINEREDPISFDTQFLTTISDKSEIAITTLYVQLRQQFFIKGVFKHYITVLNGGGVLTDSAYDVYAHKGGLGVSGHKGIEY